VRLLAPAAGVLAPALLVAVPFLGGAAAALLLFNQLHPIPEILLAGAALIGLIGAVGAYVSDDRASAAALSAAVAALAGLSLGLGDARRVYRTSLASWLETTPAGAAVTLRGALMEDAALTASGAVLLVDVQAIEVAEAASGDRIKRVSGGVRLSVAGTLFGDRLPGWRAGRVVRVPAFLRQPPTYLNPGTPDDRPALARKGIVLVGSVKSAALVEVLARGHLVSEAAAAVRAAIRRRLGDRIGRQDPRAAGVATAVLIGDRSGLTAEDERRLQDAGTYHVIAISGGNIAILAVIGLAAARLLLVQRRLGPVVTAVLLVFYGSVASGAASVARAVMVAVLVLLARALDHRVQPINVLAIAALLAVAAAPAVVLDAGFHLSFGATLGILLGLPRIEAAAGLGPRLVGVRALLALLFRMVAATACAEIALAPIAATLFGRISFAGLGLNLIAIPLMTVVQIAGLAVAAVPPWAAPVSEAAGIAVQWSASGLLRSAALVEWAPWLAHDVAAPAWWLIAAYYASALALLSVSTTRPAAPCYIACAALVITGPSVVARDAVPRSAMPMRVVVLDVGQGDATVVSLLGGRTLLVDAGGVATLTSGPDAFDAPPGFDIGDRVVSRVLRALRVRRLDDLILTHGDPDHILGVRGVLKQFPPSAIWEGVPVPSHTGLRILNELASRGGIAWRTVQAGDVERHGDVEVRVLHPPLPDWERQRVRNEDSIVLELRLGEVSIILPGDIGREAEPTILPRLDPGRLVILKAPHHGSASSSTQALLDHLRPAAVIFSCGRYNRFGHPHPAVVERYRAMGTALFSTAEDGAVFVESDGRDVEVRGFASGREITIQRRSP
jgi:competence protein ComEC